MADLEPPAESPEPESGGGIASYLNSTRNVIGAITALIVAVSGLLLALNKAGILGDDDGPITETKPPDGLFREMTSPIGRVYFDDGGAMYVRANRPSRPVVHPADLEESLHDVSLRAKVTWLSGAADYGTSFLCRYESNRNYYALGVLSGGRYNIVRYRDGRPVSLTGGIKESGLINDRTNDVTARCVGDDPTSLTLEVNGSVVAKRTDADGIEEGNIGVRASSGESFVTVRFDEFTLRYL